MSLYLAIALCAVLAALLVYRYDLYEKESWFMLALAMGLGAVTMRLVGAVELSTLVYFETNGTIAALAAFEEEAARLVAVGMIAVVFPAQFNDPMDGIVYGSIVGLGMGLEESFHLLNLLAAPNVLTLPVELVRLLGHLVMGGIAGFGLGLLRLRVAGWHRALGATFFAAWAIHFLWDWVALASPEAFRLSPGLTVAAIAIMLFGILFYGFLVVRGASLSKGVFAPDSMRTLWGWPLTLLMRKEKGDP